MWLVTINCSGDAWKRHSKEFLALAEQYSGTCTQSKKMPDGQRIMEYQIEEVSDAEDFEQGCQKIEGFSASFESL